MPPFLFSSGCSSIMSMSLILSGSVNSLYLFSFHNLIISFSFLMFFSSTQLFYCIDHRWLSHSVGRLLRRNSTGIVVISLCPFWFLFCCYIDALFCFPWRCPIILPCCFTPIGHAAFCTYASERFLFSCYLPPPMLVLVELYWRFPC